MINNTTAVAQLNPLNLLQNHFCLMKLGGQISIVERFQANLVLSGQSLEEIAFYDKPSGELLMKRFLESQPLRCNTKETISDFWISPTTHVYTAIAFSPAITSSTTLNYWVGTLVKSSQGDWECIRRHLHNVICAGDQKLYEYLLNYLAHMLQKPEDKPGIMVVLLGKQGTGKGLFFQILQRIWSRTSLLVSDIQQVVGQFNGALERHYVIIMDEALFSGDRKSQDRMKSLITEKTCHIEQKYQPARAIESVHRFFASSNHEQFAHTEADDRRYLVARVSDEKQGDHKYFADLASAIDDDQVISAMVYELERRDLTGFNVRSRPLTLELGNQKLKSLQGFDRFWFEVLMTGRFGYDLYLGTKLDEAWEDNSFMATTELVDWYQKFDKSSQRFGTSITKDISDSLARLCPSAKKDRHSRNNVVKRGFILPEISIARDDFMKAYNLTIDWDDASQAVTKYLELEEEPIWESELVTMPTQYQISWNDQAH